MRRYPTGELALVDIEAEGRDWLEWCAALYESAYADQESSPGRYASAAHRLAEELEYAIYYSQVW